jgi:hypothetical protein
LGGTRMYSSMKNPSLSSSFILILTAPLRSIRLLCCQQAILCSF